MNGGDMSNADLGIAVVDAEGAKERLQANNLDEQLSLTENTMSERTLGYLLSVFIVVLGIIWAIDAPAIIQYGVTAVSVITIGFVTYRSLRSKARLEELRKRQSEVYARKG